MSATNLSFVNGQSAMLAKLVADIICKQDHELCHLLPPPNTCAEYLWIAHKFRMPMLMYRTNNNYIIVIVSRTIAGQILTIVLYFLKDYVVIVNRSKAE